MIANTTKRRSFLKGAGGLATVCLAGCVSEGESDGGLTVGGAPSGSTQYGAWQGILRVVEEQSDDLNLTIQETDGGVANLRMIDQGQIDLGGTSNFDLINAANDSRGFEDEPVDEVPAQGFRYAVMHIYTLARADTDIETYDDLRGREIWPLAPGMSVRQPTEVFFQEAGLWEEMEINNMDQDDVPGALEEGRLDAIVAYGSSFETIPGYFQQAETRADLRALEMEEEHQDLIRDHELIPYEEIEPYGWEEDVGSDEVSAWSLDFQMFFGNDVSDDVAYELTSLVGEHTDTVRDSQPAFPDGPERMAEAITPDLPIHPGALEAYEEFGVADDQWTVE